MTQDGLKSRTEIYQRCSGDCLFATERCPIDGWSTHETRLIHREKLQLQAMGGRVAVDDLRARLNGTVPDRYLNALVEITFCDEAGYSDGFVPSEAWVLWSKSNRPL